MNTTGTPTHAIVIGGSMAGLLTARVLSDHFSRVTIIERDTLPDGEAHRAGVPQARHLHGLLVKGQQIMDVLFPGFTDDMNARGCPQGTWAYDTAFRVLGGWTPRFDSGIRSNASGRVTLEHLVRTRIRRIPNIAFMPNHQVEALVSDDGGRTVAGVRLFSRADKTETTLTAHLVVDASGRGSKASAWLGALGLSTPEVTIVNAHTGYASRWFRHAPEMTLEYGVVGIQTSPAIGLYRGGGYLVAEDDTIVVTLIGANGDYPPTDEDGFIEFARSLATPVLYEIVRHAEPTSPIYGYRKLESQQRHYERLADLPDNFIVTGDAAVALNPIYGQGMTTAALEALELMKLLQRVDVMDLSGFSRRFQRRLHQITRGPWLMATSEDMRYPGVEGGKPDLMTRMIHRYFDMVAYTMPYDKVVTTGFIEAMALLKPPTVALMHPRVMLRVLRHHLFSRGVVQDHEPVVKVASAARPL